MAAADVSRLQWYISSVSTVLLRHLNRHPASSYVDDEDDIEEPLPAPPPPSSPDPSLNMDDGRRGSPARDRSARSSSHSSRLRLARNMLSQSPSKKSRSPLALSKISQGSGLIVAAILGAVGIWYLGRIDKIQVVWTTSYAKCDERAYCESLKVLSTDQRCPANLTWTGGASPRASGIPLHPSASTTGSLWTPFTAVLLALLLVHSLWSLFVAALVVLSLYLCKMLARQK